MFFENKSQFNFIEEMPKCLLLLKLFIDLPPKGKVPGWTAQAVPQGVDHPVNRGSRDLMSFDPSYLRGISFSCLKYDKL